VTGEDATPGADGSSTAGGASRNAGLPPEVLASLDALAKRHRLGAGAVNSLAALLVVVAEDDHAPTTVRDPLRAVDDHLADSLVALDSEYVRGASTVADIGSGAGFPGLPLAIALPRAQVTLIESSARKCTFIERARTFAGVDNASVVHSRVEGWRTSREACDLVTARALAPLPVVVEYAAPLLRVGGVLVAWRGRRDSDAEAEAARAADQLGLEPREPWLVSPYPGAEHRHLHLMFKVRETPAQFPRRPGVALKRPLGLADGGSARPRRHPSDRSRR
jgi:16S rRNA (guanine527-N7)-methyltransferase